MQHGMNMVRHHHPGVQVKPLVGMKLDCSGNKVYHLGSPQVAIAMTRIEIIVHAH